MVKKDSHRLGHIQILYLSLVKAQADCETLCLKILQITNGYKNMVSTKLSQIQDKLKILIHNVSLDDRFRAN